MADITETSKDGKSVIFRHLNDLSVDVPEFHKDMLEDTSGYSDEEMRSSDFLNGYSKGYVAGYLGGYSEGATRGIDDGWVAKQDEFITKAENSSKLSTGDTNKLVAISCDRPSVEVKTATSEDSIKKAEQKGFDAGWNIGAELGHSEGYDAGYEDGEYDWSEAMRITLESDEILASDSKSEAFRVLEETKKIG